MASIPLPALYTRPPEQQADPLAQYGKLVALQGLLANQRYQQQAQPLELQEQQQRIQDQQTQNQVVQQQLKERTAMNAIKPNYLIKDDSGKVTGFDYDGYFKALDQSPNVSFATAQTQRNQYTEAQTKTATLTKDQLDNADKLTSDAFQHLEAVRNAQTPIDKQIALLTAKKWMQQNKMDTSQIPDQVPDDATLSQYEMNLGMGKQILDDSKSKGEIAEKQAQAEKARREAIYGTGQMGEDVRAHLAAQGITNPTPKDIAAAQDDYNRRTKIAPAEVRVAPQWAMPTPVIGQDQNLGFATRAQIAQNPQAYAPAGEGTKVMGAQARMNDLQRSIKAVQDDLSNPKMPEFTASQTAHIAIAMRSDNPSSAISALFQSGVLGSLGPEQQQYLIDHAQLMENSMVMRTQLGAGQGSEDLRNATWKTVPGPTTPSKKYGLDQLAAMKKTADVLQQGIPKMAAAPPLSQTTNTPAAGGTKVGDKKTLKNGRIVTVTAVHPDGTWDAD